MINRREFSGGLLAAVVVRRDRERAAQAAALAALAALERDQGGRFGVCVLDTASGRGFGWRADERFGQCSTFKLTLAARVLAGIDAGEIGAAEVLRFGPGDLLPGSPVTGQHAGEGGMTVTALAEAAQTTSDNLAANLLLRRIGGPAELTRFWRRLGALQCRLDRFEPDLNFQPPGEVRDTATPRGIARAVAAIVGPRVLAPASRDRLLGWMAATTTGAARIRAGLPRDWRAGDKTGTGYRAGMGNLTNDTAVAWPEPGAAPLVIAGFRQAAGHTPAVRPADEAALRLLGELAAKWSVATR